MKIKVVGIISLIGVLGFTLFIPLAYVANELSIDNSEDLFFSIALVITTISTFLYLMWTKFGNLDSKSLRILRDKNEIIKEQIKQKELLEALEN